MKLSHIIIAFLVFLVVTLSFLLFLSRRRIGLLIKENSENAHGKVIADFFGGSSAGSRYVVEVQEVDLPCPAGSLVIKQNNPKMCTKCPINSYSNTQDSIKCDACPQGFYSHEGSANCYNCDCITTIGTIDPICVSCGGHINCPRRA